VQTVESYSENLYPSRTRYAFEHLLPGTYVASLDGSTRSPSFRTVHITDDMTRNLKPGPPLPQFTGSAVVATPDGDVPTLAAFRFASSLLPYRGIYYPDEGYGPLGVALANFPAGALSGETLGEDVTLDEPYGVGSELFPAGSPAVATLPATVTSRTFQAKNGVLDLGTVRYTVDAEGTSF
jgi:hypothetical protein